MSTRGHQLPTSPNPSQLEAKCTALIEAVPDPIVLVDSENHIVLANEMATALFGYSKGELAGKSVETLLPQRFRTAPSNTYFTPSHGGSASKPSELFGVRR